MLLVPLKEFQTRSELHDALLGMLKDYYKATRNSKTPTQYVAFYGSYSIVADPDVSTAKQTMLVSQDLRKIVKLPHRCVTWAPRIAVVLKTQQI